MSTTEHDDLVAKFPGIDPFLLKKWERIFNVFFDRNASHEMDWGDFYLVVRQCRDIYGAQSEQMKYARSSMKTLWDALKEQTHKKSGDELIHVDEWVTILQGSDKDHENPWFNEYMAFMFKLFDVSENDCLDLAEYTDGMHCYGYKEWEAHEAHKLFSIDRKTKKPIQGVNFKGFKELWHEYFHATDREALGNNLFGKLDEGF